MWQLLTNETNKQAARIKTAKPKNYCAKHWTHEATVREMKAFFACRVAIEMLVYKDCYEQYWRVKDNLLTATPGFSKVFFRDQFLAIYSRYFIV